MAEFKPLLSATVEDVEKLKYPLLASPKIDGIRAAMVGGHLLTRKLKFIPNAFVRRELEKHAVALEGFDGELVVPGGFQAVTSGIMSRDGAPDFEYCVFDFWAHDDAFVRRLDLARKIADKLDHPRVHVVAHVGIHDPAQLLSYEAKCLEAGFEGVMLRDPHGLYKFGRSTLREGILMKLKRFVDFEAEIIGFEEKMHNGNEATTDALGHTKRSTAKAGKRGAGTLGALLCRRDDGVEFSVGTGSMGEAWCAAWWLDRNELIGQLAKVKHLPHGVKEKPRHPILLGLRDRSDT